MSRTDKSYFARLYAADPDPWGFETKWYEQRKYDLTLASLPKRRYRSAFEPGCSIGVLSERLAERCEHLLCMEQMPEVASAATHRLAHLGHVEVRQGEVPEAWPVGPFDLLVLSELCYYFGDAELRELLQAATASLEPDATIVAVHWRGRTDYPLGGDAAHSVIHACGGFHRLVHHEECEFLLDVWRFSR